MPHSIPSTPQAIKEARRGYKQRFPEHAEESETWSDEIFLNRAKLTLDGQITRTTLLLVGKEESAHYLNHIAQIVWKCFQDGKVFGDIFTIPFLLSTTEILHKIRNYRFKIYPRNSLIPNEVWKYDNETILECMHNCIAHQNYTSNARIIVTEDADKLTFENVGNFYEGSYEDYILGEKTPKHYRNPFLAQAMVNVKMIDTQGYGIHTMYEKQRERYLPMPDYDESSPEKVVLKLHGSIIDENYSQILMERKDLTLSETVLLDRVQKHKTISSEAIDLLREKNLVEGRKPNVYVSKHIAKATGKEVEYIQEKGFSDRNYREMILDALKEHKELSKEKLNALMLPVFPKSLSEEQKKRKLTNMLHYLRSKGAISYDNRKKVWRYETSSF